MVEVRTWVRGTGCGIYPARWMTKDDEVIWEQGSRTAVRKSDDCCRQSATHPLRAGASDPKSKGGGEAHWTLIRGADDYSVPSGVPLTVSGTPRSFGVMPGAATKSLRMTAGSPSRSSPLSHDSNTQIGFQRDAWQVLFQGRASGVNTVEAQCQGVGRFALRIPDESTGTRALPTCPDRRQ